MIQIQVNEEQRQVILLAIAELSLRRPGWDDMLSEIADVFRGREMYEGFKGVSNDD